MASHSNLISNIQKLNLKLQAATADSKMTDVTENIDEATEIFNLCSKPECPRDIRFECESLIDYAEAELSKSKKYKSNVRSEHVHKLLSVHLIENLNKCESSRKNKFRCTVCQVKPIGSIADCILHLSGSSHQKLELLYQLNYTVQHIPEPSEEHCVSVGRAIYQYVGKHVISSTEVMLRKRVTHLLNEDLRKSNIGCALSLYGSSLTELGFENSDINISVCIPESLTQPVQANKTLQKFIAFLQSHPLFVKLSPSSRSHIANLHLANEEKTSELILGLKINDDDGVKTSKLFAKYVSLSSMVQPLVVAFRLWAKLCKVDCRGKEGMPPHAFTSMVIFFLQKEKHLPVLDLATISDSTLEYEETKTKKINVSPDLLGHLWIKFLRFYSDEDLYASIVISISEETEVTKEQRRWTERKLAIADPVKPILNLTRKAMSNNRMCEYIVKCLKCTYAYFGIPRTIRGPLYDLLLSNERKDICAPYVFHKFISGAVANSKSKDHKKIVDKIDNPKWNPISMAEELRGAQWFKKFSFRLESVKARLFINHQNQVCVLVDDASVLEHIFPDWLYQYKFDQEILGNLFDDEPPITCKGCSSKQHYMTECPLEVLPYNPKSFSEVSWSTSCIINEVLTKNYENDKLTPNDIAVRQSIMSSIKSAVSRVFPNISLQLFGSSINGFGTNRSDVDISVEFGDVIGTNDQHVLLTKMAKIRNILYKMDEFKIIHFARNARIPVVKFIHMFTNIEGDLSGSNGLAVHNSHLLRTYAEIDPRVKIIGLFLKKLVKLCEISEASKSSLSSYGYTLMVIHYLQQLENPILPVLHELPHDGPGSTNAEGWKIQYFSDIENLKQVWPALSENRQSLSELWLGFLSYYTNKFNFEEHVITIRQLKPLTRLSKFWLTDSLIAIEDPFILSHNIGLALSRKMSIHILKTLGRFYEIFQINYDSSMLGSHKNWLSYFTDPSLIREGRPPVNWHQCYICRHIGHAGRDCPEKQDKKQKSPEDMEEDTFVQELTPKRDSLTKNDGVVKNGRN